MGINAMNSGTASELSADWEYPRKSGRKTF